MEERNFKNRREQADYYAKLRGWGPLTEEDKIALDDAVGIVTNLDSRTRYAVQPRITQNPPQGLLSRRLRGIAAHAPKDFDYKKELETRF